MMPEAIIALSRPLENLKIEIDAVDLFLIGNKTIFEKSFVHYGCYIKAEICRKGGFMDWKRSDYSSGRAEARGEEFRA